LSARLNSVLRLESGWMLQCDAIRSRAPGYPAQGAFPDGVTRVIDDERRQQFMQELRRLREVDKVCFPRVTQAVCS